MGTKRDDAQGEYLMKQDQQYPTLEMCNELFLQSERVTNAKIS